MDKLVKISEVERIIKKTGTHEIMAEKFDNWRAKYGWYGALCSLGNFILKSLENKVVQSPYNFTYVKDEMPKNDGIYLAICVDNNKNFSYRVLKYSTKLQRFFYPPEKENAYSIALYWAPLPKLKSNYNE